MNRLKNKVAIITGGAGGIGKATAKLFLSEGAKVMLVGRTEQTLKKVIDEFDSPNIVYCVGDVSKSEDTKNYVNETVSKFGTKLIFSLIMRELKVHQNPL
ncbi:SDR family NAD(P)-dependent oxidoreductase [Thalassobellus suaedae]|uniref:SDR family NAD(P)-dependent oxidoreductase n=1 Tax=Thalassobellus suaedae TaxID=3074124 RepID=A0ABY9XWY8_9FLAO|nr:SDR family NAD(P)-dependent oxidoreductase [Flavobacteriaceae bacterium HL-DH14]